MHSLSLLLLGAAAGVNAMLGAEIEAVVLPDNQFICAEDCVHQGVFFGTRAACLENETVVALDKDGQPSIDLNTGSSLVCRGHPVLSLPGRGQRERKADETPEQCDLQPITDPERIGCFSNRDIGGGPAGETLQWADVAKLVEEAGLPAPGPAPGRAARGPKVAREVHQGGPDGLCQLRPGIRRVRPARPRRH
ncbi:hypothetical protein BBAD15_g6926 [Beauveria bassiana D1-5]|uniref:Uncharacterized protein n=1 Tax=Beauveria bassiana D1-5 TaxID=1245745 RepID=A0A0A2VN60_BEABA|nr:hypothetical protein BBAD15_g6926 [Beauveria bassiana D1-5]